MQIKIGGKFLDIKQGFIKMLEAYRNIRKLIQKLTKKKSHHLNDIEILIQEVKRVQKISERQIRHFAQLHLVNQVQSMLKAYIYKGDVKFRRYDVYSHVLCFLNLLHSKISEFVPKNIDLCQVTPQLMKWKLFLSELNQNKQSIIIWLKQTSEQNNNLRLHQKSNSIYKISTFMTKSNTPSTAIGSTNLSARMINIEAQNLNQSQMLKRHSYLKRCQTAKLPMNEISRKKYYPLNIRCPSAKQVLNKKISLNSIAQFSSSKPNVVNRKMKKKKLFFRSPSTHQNIFENSIEIIKLKQNSDSIDKSFLKDKKLLVQSRIQQVIEKEEAKNDQDEEDSKYINANLSKNIHSNQRRSSIRKIKQNICQTQIIKSPFNKQNQRKAYSDDQGHENESVSEVQKGGKNLNNLNKRGKHLKANTNGSNDNIQQNSLSPKKDLKKSVYFQFSKEPLQQSIQKIQLVVFQEQKGQIADKKSTRRHGMISSKEIVTNLDKLDLKFRQQQKQRQNQLKRKALAFNSKLIEQLGDINQDFQIIDYEKEIQQQHLIKKCNFNDFYKQLSYLKVEQKKVIESSPLGGQSIFFFKQDVLRQQKSRQLQQYIKKLRAKQRSLGEIFEMKSQESNIKIHNYMKLERKYAFEADADWIKNHLKISKKVETQDSMQLIQQSPQTENGFSRRIIYI